MKKQIQTYLHNHILLLIIALIGILCACLSLGRRMAVEAQNDTYDIVLDYNEMKAMADQSDYDVTWWLQELKKDGINKVGLYEETLASIEKEHLGTVSASLVYALNKADAQWQDAYPQALLQKAKAAYGLDPYDVLVTVRGKALCQKLVEAITSRYPNISLLTDWTAGGEDDDIYTVFLDGTEQSTLYTATTKVDLFDGTAVAEERTPLRSVYQELSLYLDEAKVQTVTRQGYRVIPRTVTYDGFNGAETARDALEDAAKAVGTAVYYFPGNAVLGQDDGCSVLLEYLTETQTPVCLVETSSQLGNLEVPGMEQLMQATAYQAVRAFTMWDFIQKRYAYFGYDDATEIENSMFRAITERNVSVIYFKPFKMTDEEYQYITDPAEYHQVFQNLAARLERHNKTLGTAKPFEQVTTPFVLKLIMAFGAVAAAILLLETLTPVSKKLRNVLLAIGAAGVVGCYYAAPNLSALVSALASAVIWPCLACGFYMAAGAQLEQQKGPAPAVGKSLLTGAVLLIAGSLLALAGGLTAAAPFTENAYLLEEASFRGIKASQILPMVYALAAYTAWFGFRKDKEHRGRLECGDFTHLLQLNIRVWMALAAAVLGVCAYIYIARTGHTSNVTTPTIELQLRSFLETVLLARPRTKEFLIAFPCLMLFAYAAAHRYRFFTFIFGFGSVIGFASVANSYMHLRTPVYMSLCRLAGSLPMGLVIGALCVLAFHGVCLLWEKHRV